MRHGSDKPPKVEPWVDKDLMVFAPTLYDAAYKAKLTTAEVDWVAITRPKTIHWSFPERPSLDGKVEQEMIAAGLLRPEQIGWFHGPGEKNRVWVDETWTRAASFIFEKHHPNLLLFHLLNTDTVQHQCGPGSTAGYTSLAYADRLLGDVLDTVKQSGLQARTTVFVTSDHGFKKVSKVICPNAALKQAGYLTASNAVISSCEAVSIAGGGLAFVHVTNSERKAELLPRLQELFAGTEGVARIVDGHDGPTLGMPTPEENQGMGDLVLFAKSGYAFKNDVQEKAVVTPAQGYLGTHGYLAGDSEMDGILIACGNGIKRGVLLPRVANLDVAPTIARLLGIEMPAVEGRVLTEILTGR